MLTIQGAREMKCEDCKFWEAPKGAHKLGSCHRYPPTLISDTQGGVDNIFSDIWTGYPNTDSDEWCGEFEPKEPKT